MQKPALTSGRQRQPALHTLPLHVPSSYGEGGCPLEPGAGGEHKISRGFEPTRIHSVHRIFNKRLDTAVHDFCRREAVEVLRVTTESEAISGLKPYAPKPLRPASE